MDDLPAPPPATDTEKKKRSAEIKDASTTSRVASFDPDAPPSSDADSFTLITPPPTTPKRAKKKAGDAIAEADTTSYLLVELKKCGVEEKFLERSCIGAIGETEREELVGLLKELQDVRAGLCAKRVELILDQISMILEAPFPSTEDAEGGGATNNESKPQPEKYLAQLYDVDPVFSEYPEETWKKGLENIPVSMWKEMQVRWRHLQSAERDLVKKRCDMAIHYLRVMSSKWRFR